jgi:hypothetical protein
MRKVLPTFLFALSLFFGSALNAQLTLGGLVFTGYNKDDNTVNGSPADDEFSFVLLQNIPAGQQIFFTDFGWRSDAAAFQSANPCGASTGSLSDGVIRWQTAVALNRGTHVRIRCRVSLTANIGTVTGITATANVPTDYMSLALGGDQIFAYTGTFAAPTLIAGIDLSGAWEATLLNCTVTSAQSVLPAALSTNNYAFAPSPEVDNGRLLASIKLTNPANAATDRANIHNQANWEFNDVTAYVLPGNLFVLPVNFTFIKAAEKGGQVQVDFGVGTEEDITEYVIERSADGRLYSSIGSVPAARRSSYSFADIKPLAGTNFYRIRAVEINGAPKYSTVANINLSKAGQGIGVYPSIVKNNQFTLQITNLPGGNYRLNIHNAVGQLVVSRNMNHNGGSSVQTINLPAGIQKGVYKVSVTGAAETAVRTIVVE